MQEAIDQNVQQEEVDPRVARVKRALFLLFFVFVGLGALALIVGTQVPAQVNFTSCDANAVHVSDYIVSCSLQNAVQSILRLVAIFVLSFFCRWLTREITGASSAEEQNRDMHTPDFNDSPAMIIIGGAIMAALVVAKVPFVGFMPFIVNLVFKYSLGMIYFLVVDYYLLRLVSVKTVERYVNLMNLSGTNAVAWATFGALLIAGILVTANVF